MTASAAIGKRELLMTSRTTAALAASLLLVALAGCSSPATDTTAPPAAPSAEPASPSPSGDDAYGGGTDASAAGLAVAESSLGEVVVDGDGMTVYMFDNDTQGAGTSSCAGECAANWPAVTTEGDAPVVDGVTGEVGTITGVDGATQVTLNGWPLYTFAGDSAAGDVNGQGVNDVWWVLSPDGERMGE
jgi:predicted lipoprotein with Yx(FWY)xxD motif